MPFTLLRIPTQVPMKNNLLLLVFSFYLLSCSFSETTNHKGQPVIQANSDYSEYRVGEDWYRGYWSIAPHVEHDTLKITCYNAIESFEFKTDNDSIEFEIGPGGIKDFYIQMGEDTFAHTIIQGMAFETTSLSFENTSNPNTQFKFQNEESAYLNDLKKEYPLDFIDDEKSDTEVVLAVLNWTHNRWNHNGNNSPSKNDAITILNEAKEGQEFPCFAYAIVLRDQLSALGFKARTVYLKTKDAATRRSSPGHVASEVYLVDLQKWVFVDGQFNVMPILDDIPLNAVEFQDAISNRYADFELMSLSEEKTSKNSYVNFVYDYLYYFDASFDNRYEKEEWFTVDGKSSLMLVPSGVENLSRINFWDSEINYCLYTNSLEDFYARPI